MQVSLSDAGIAAAARVAQARRAKFAQTLASVPEEKRMIVVEAVSALAEAARDRGVNNSSTPRQKAASLPRV
jgi:DNA-binding MarR family transcriptional regulator